MIAVRRTDPLMELFMSEEALAETSTETDDAPASIEADAPETPEAKADGEPTDNPDADSEPALEAEATPEIRSLEEQLARAEKKLSKTSYEGREAKRREAQLMSMLEQSNKPQTESKAPNVEDYETLDEYVDARFEYLSKKGAEPAAPSDNGAQAAFTQAKEDLFFEGTSKYEDFAEVVAGDHVNITPMMANAIFEIGDMDAQVELTYALSKNAKEATRISRLSPMRQAAEIGKLEAKLSTPTAKKQASTAPKPVKSVSGANTNSTAHQLNDDMKTFMKKRNQELGRG